MDEEFGDVERVWADAVAVVEADRDAGSVDEAHEVYLAEAGRTRLRDRRGRVRLALRSGGRVEGELCSPQEIIGCLLVAGEDGATHAVAESSVIWMAGSEVALRAEEGPAQARARERSLASWLREAWVEGAPVRLLTSSGEQVVVTITFVGADHVEGARGAERLVLPVTSVEVWTIR